MPSYIWRNSACRMKHPRDLQSKTNGYGTRPSRGIPIPAWKGVRPWPDSPNIHDFMTMCQAVHGILMWSLDDILEEETSSPNKAGEEYLRYWTVLKCTDVLDWSNVVYCMVLYHTEVLYWGTVPQAVLGRVARQQPPRADHGGWEVNTVLCSTNYRCKLRFILPYKSDFHPIFGIAQFVTQLTHV